MMHYRKFIYQPPDISWFSTTASLITRPHHSFLAGNGLMHTQLQQLSHRWHAHCHYITNGWRNSSLGGRQTTIVGIYRAGPGRGQQQPLVQLMHKQRSSRMCISLSSFIYACHWTINSLLFRFRNQTKNDFHKLFLEQCFFKTKTNAIINKPVLDMLI